MSGSEELSREKLVALVEQQTRLIVEQAERIAALQAEVAELKRWLGATRATRSQPPSTSEPAAPQRVRSTARLVLRMPRQSGHVGGLVVLRMLRVSSEYTPVGLWEVPIRQRRRRKGRLEAVRVEDITFGGGQVQVLEMRQALRCRSDLKWFRRRLDPRPAGGHFAGRAVTMPG